MFFYLTYADNANDGGKYALVCDMHGSLLQDNNKQRLWGWADKSAEWCLGCAGLDPRFDNYDDTKVVA